MLPEATRAEALETTKIYSALGLAHGLIDTRPFRLTPVVIEFDDVPWVRDRAAASRLPELAMLSVMAHPELEIAEAAVEAISQLPEDRRQLYLDVILHAVPAAIQQTLETQMIKGYEYQSDFARKYYGQGISEGLEKGRKKGKREGKKGGLRAAGQHALTELITLLGQARSARKARVALDRVLDV